MSSSSQKNNRRANDRPLFTNGDYLVVRRAMDELPIDQKLAVELRFFHNYSIREIAQAFLMTWDQANAFLEAIFSKLRKLCLAESNFTRNTQLARAA